jgi:uncharacterized protein (DUF983 family)
MFDLSKLKRSSKKDEIPGTVEAYLDEICPSCMKGRLAKYRPCCGSPKGYTGCKTCGYKIIHGS